MKIAFIGAFTFLQKSSILTSPNYFVDILREQGEEMRKFICIMRVFFSKMRQIREREMRFRMTEAPRRKHPARYLVWSYFLRPIKDIQIQEIYGL